MIFSINTGLYFFSALLQADAAIFAVLAVFIVFKLQYQQAITLNLRPFILQGVTPEQRLIVREFDSANIERKRQIAEQYKNTGLMSWLYHELPQHEKAEELKSKFKYPGIYLVTLIAGDIIGLLTIESLHHCNQLLEIIVFVVVAIAHVIMMINLLINIQNILKK
jgi:hypothetical protein